MGGIHPTIRQEESLEHADIVCVGDGEEAILELVTRMGKAEPYTDIRNLGFKKNGTVIKNPPRSLPHNLDIYPIPDYSLDDQHIMYEGKIRPLTYDLMKTYLENGTVSQYLRKIGYQTMTDRGCPHKCSYCNISNQKEMYDEMGSKYFRARSVENFINELVEIKEMFPFIEAIQFFDDTFFARPVHEIEEFSRGYKEKVGLPFIARGALTP